MRLDVLPELTRGLFEYAASCGELSPFTLIGGTALAVQAGHRLSHDLDFAVFDEVLPGHTIDQWIDRLREAGVPADNITDPTAASRFRVNTGLPLERFVCDYEIGGVKVTFVAHGRTEAQRRYYRSADTLRSPDRSFAVLGIEALKAAKTLVLADRVRSRDLYDVMVLMRDHGLTVERQVQHIKTLGHNNDINHYFAVMTGDMPLDRDDEGLAVVGSAITIDDVYGFLTERVNEWQTERAAQEFERNDPPRES